jgi:hypothetical protein
LFAPRRGWAVAAGEINVISAEPFETLPTAVLSPWQSLFFQPRLCGVSSWRGPTWLLTFYPISVAPLPIVYAELQLSFFAPRLTFCVWV